MNGNISLGIVGKKKLKNGGGGGMEVLPKRVNRRINLVAHSYVKLSDHTVAAAILPTESLFNFVISCKIIDKN